MPHLLFKVAPETTNLTISSLSPPSSTLDRNSTPSPVNEQKPNSNSTQVGIRGASATNESVQPFVTIQETHSTAEASVKPSTLESDFVGCESVIHLGDRVSQINTNFEGTTQYLWALVKESFVYKKVISNYSLWHANIRVHVVPVFSPFSRGMYRIAYSYFDRYDAINHKTFNLHTMTGGTFIDFDIADGEGAMLSCDNITARSMYKNSNLVQEFIPGSVSLRSIKVDDALGGTFRVYIHFDDLKVAYPRAQSVLPFTNIVPQMLDNASNPIDKTKTFITPNYSVGCPQKTEDDMLFDNMSKAMPYYIEPVEFSTVGGSSKKNLSDLLIDSMFDDSNMTRYFHPLTTLLSCFQGIRCDYEVTLRVIKNSFQAGVLYVRYGEDETSAAILASTISEYNTIAWNIAEQKEITFTVPYANTYKAIKPSSDSRFYRIFNLDPIIPNPGGEGVTVDVYGMVRLKNLSVMYPVNSSLIGVPLSGAPFTNVRAQNADSENDTTVGTLNPSAAVSFLSNSLRPFLSLFDDKQPIELSQNEYGIIPTDFNLFSAIMKVFGVRSGDITFVAGTNASWIEKFSMFGTLGTIVPATVAELDWPITQPGWIVTRGATIASPLGDANNTFPLATYPDVVYSLRKCKFGYPIIPVIEKIPPPP